MAFKLKGKLVLKDDPRDQLSNGVPNSSCLLDVGELARRPSSRYTKFMSVMQPIIDNVFMSFEYRNSFDTARRATFVFKVSVKCWKFYDFVNWSNFCASNDLTAMPDGIYYDETLIPFTESGIFFTTDSMNIDNIMRNVLVSMIAE